MKELFREFHNAIGERWQHRYVSNPHHKRSVMSLTCKTIGMLFLQKKMDLTIKSTRIYDFRSKLVN